MISWQPIGCEGLTAQMMHGNGMGFNWTIYRGSYTTHIFDVQK